MYQHYQTPPKDRRQRYHHCGQPIEWGDYYLGYVMQPQFWVEGKQVTVCPKCGYRLTTTHLHLSPFAHQIATAATLEQAEAVVANLESHSIPAAAVPHWLWGWTVFTSADHIEKARAIVKGDCNADQ